ATRLADTTDPHAAARYAGYRSRVVSGLVDKQDVVALLEFRVGNEIIVDPARVSDVRPLPHRAPAPDTPELPAALRAWEAGRSVFRLGRDSLHGSSHWLKVDHNVLALWPHVPGA